MVFVTHTVAGATVSLNETNIVVQEGDDSNTTVYICIVLANDMGGLQRDIVVDLTVMPDTANSKSTMFLNSMLCVHKCYVYKQPHSRLLTTLLP